MEKGQLNVSKDCLKSPEHSFRYGEIIKSVLQGHTGNSLSVCLNTWS